MKIAIYPGSFDPITLGHLDIIRRGAACFDKLYVCVMVNCEKKLPMFTPERRLELIRRSVADIPNVEVENWSGLLADFVRSKDAHILVKGVRNCADWELEAQMARINGGICPGLETVLPIYSDNFSPRPNPLSSIQNGNRLSDIYHKSDFRNKEFLSLLSSPHQNPVEDSP